SRRRHTRSLRDWSSDVCSSDRSEEHTSELQSRRDLVCRLLLDKSSDVCSDRKSTRLNSSHVEISYAVFCLKKTAPATVASRGAHPARARRRTLGLRQRRGHVFSRRPIPLHKCGPDDLPRPSSFFLKDRAPTEISPLSLPDPLPI